MNEVPFLCGPSVVGSDFGFSTITIAYDAVGNLRYLVRYSANGRASDNENKPQRQCFAGCSISTRIRNCCPDTRWNLVCACYRSPRLADPHVNMYLNVQCNTRISTAYLYVQCTRAWAPRRCETRHRCCTRGVIYYGFGFGIIILFRFHVHPRRVLALQMFCTYGHIDYRSYACARACIYVYTHVYRDVYDGGR